MKNYILNTTLIWNKLFIHKLLKHHCYSTYDTCCNSTYGTLQIFCELRYLFTNLHKHFINNYLHIILRHDFNSTGIDT